MNRESSEDFRNWLISSRNLHKRSAGDIISRRKKLIQYVKDPTILTMEQIKAQLEQEFVKGVVTKSTLSGMLRSEKLFRIFTESRI
ncbi:hypothetical protein MCETRE36_00434 [Candidatus Planktophila dulcis]